MQIHPDAAAVAHQESVRVVTLTAERFAEANDVQNAFVGTKSFCNCLPYSICLEPIDDFAKHYRKHPESLEYSAVAIVAASSDDPGRVVGLVKVSSYGVPQRWDDALMHEVKPKECHVISIAVSAEARGKGVGTKLLQWVEAKAREKACDRITLHVVRGNPAIRLYERVGFEIVPEDGPWCSDVFACFLIGRPHSQCGAHFMEKKLLAGV